MEGGEDACARMHCMPQYGNKYSRNRMEPDLDLPDLDSRFEIQIQICVDAHDFLKTGFMLLYLLIVLIDEQDKILIGSHI
jgi:hypothetical protein